MACVFLGRARALVQMQDSEPPDNWPGAEADCLSLSTFRAPGKSFVPNSRLPRLKKPCASTMWGYLHYFEGAPCLLKPTQRRPMGGRVVIIIRVGKLFIEDRFPSLITQALAAFAALASVSNSDGTKFEARRSAAGSIELENLLNLSVISEFHTSSHFPGALPLPRATAAVTTAVDSGTAQHARAAFPQDFTHALHPWMQLAISAECCRRGRPQLPCALEEGGGLGTKG